MAAYLHAGKLLIMGRGRSCGDRRRLNEAAEQCTPDMTSSGIEMTDGSLCRQTEAIRVLVWLIVCVMQMVARWRCNAPLGHDRIDQARFVIPCVTVTLIPNATFCFLTKTGDRCVRAVWPPRRAKLSTVRHRLP